MAPRRKPREHRITLTRGSDGNYRATGDLGDAYVTDPGLSRTSPFLPRSPAETRTLQKLLNLKAPPEGVDIRPTLASRLSVYEHPPVPGSWGHWRGKGTKRDPYRWVGISEKVALGILGAALVVWGLECIEVDISNWWSNSELNVGNDLTKLGADVLGALGIPYSTDSSGKVSSVGPRKNATFFSWLLQQVVVQGGDLEQATVTVGGLSTGFPSAQGTSNPPPGS